MHFTSLSIYCIVVLYCCCVACDAGAVSVDERKEIETAQEVLRTVEKRLVNKIHEKYAKEEQQQRQTWGNLKSTLQGFVELEKRKLFSDSDYNAPRIPHREINDVPRIPHREINDVPRIPHREINDVPRIPHRKINDAPRIPQREINQPRIPRGGYFDPPRVPHRELQREVPRVPHLDFQSQRFSRKEQAKTPRIPHQDYFNQLKLSDLEKYLLREMASSSSPKKHRELQDRSERCVSICMGIFDTCLHSIQSQDPAKFNQFQSCLGLKRSCIDNNSACV